MSSEPSPYEPTLAVAKLNLFQIRRSQAAYNHVPEMWWMLSAQFVVLITLLIVVVVI